MISAVVSQSPEEMSEHFFKTLARWGISHKAMAWVRKDTLPLSKQLYILSQRDYIHLKRSNTLPHPSRICLLMTEDYEPVSEGEMAVWKSSYLVIGNEKGRGELAAYLYAILNNSLPDEFEETSTTERKPSEIAAPWLQKKLEAIQDELNHLNAEYSSRVSFDGKKILIEAEVATPCPDWSSFCETLTPLNLPEDIEAAPGSLIFKKIARDSTITLATSIDSTSTKLHVILEVLPTQKAFEKRQRLYGVIQNDKTITGQ